ncbi:MAG: flap endonuclease-1 [Candidatus Woesearchaeota archaeon]|nr:flap endonuclease-1 [Candidatus Woesearchaeota archaeon]
MGTKLSPILVSKEISIQDLSGKKLAVDSFNMLYQFLTTVRQQDGSLLTNSRGKITSHMSGLFFRTTKMMRDNLKLAFVFDGVSPKLKKEERERRQEIKKDAETKYEEAIQKEDLELMRKYAGRTARLTSEMIEESKALIAALGMPIIQAPSEGEAQASYMVKKGDFYAVLSQDTDSLIFGSPKIVKNLSISGKKKFKAGFQTVLPELIDLGENLNHIGIDREQLIIVAILCGTDFNIGGIKGIGPKKAIDLVKKHGKDFGAVFKEVEWPFPYPWKEVYDTIYGVPVTDDYELKWSSIDEKAVYKIMVEDNEFQRERIENSIRELSRKQAQKGLGDFF